jgi:hypothetical protein
VPALEPKAEGVMPVSLVDYDVPSSLGRVAKPFTLSLPLKFALLVFSCLFDCHRCVKPGSRPQGRGPCFMQ